MSLRVTAARRRCHLRSSYLERAVVFLQLPAQTLQLAASQDGLAVLVPQRVLLLYHLVLLLLQRPHLLVRVAVHLQLSPASKRQKKKKKKN